LSSAASCTRGEPSASPRQHRQQGLTGLVEAAELEGDHARQVQQLRLGVGPVVTRPRSGRPTQADLDVPAGTLEVSCLHVAQPRQQALRQAAVMGGTAALGQFEGLPG
jgi:hypothetical protein